MIVIYIFLLLISIIVSVIFSLIKCHVAFSLRNIKLYNSFFLVNMIYLFYDHFIGVDNFDKSTVNIIIAAVILIAVFTAALLIQLKTLGYWLIMTVVSACMGAYITVTAYEAVMELSQEYGNKTLWLCGIFIIPFIISFIIQIYAKRKNQQ